MFEVGDDSKRVDLGLDSFKWDPDRRDTFCASNKPKDLRRSSLEEEEEF